MGQKGKEVLVIEVNDVIKDLDSAYADEWLSHYHYFLYAQVIEDINAELLNKNYNTLAKKYHMKDLVTHKIFEDLLKDEVIDENWENFLPILRQSGSR